MDLIWIQGIKMKFYVIIGRTVQNCGNIHCVWIFYIRVSESLKFHKSEFWNSIISIQMGDSLKMEFQVETLQIFSYI